MSGHPDTTRLKTARTLTLFARLRWLMLRGILRGNDAVFCVLRETPDKSQRVLALINITAEKQEISFPCDAIGPQISSWVDLLSEERFPVSESNLRITLTPYRVLWLTPAS